MEAVSPVRLSLLELEQALKNRELKIFYQPQFTLIGNHSQNQLILSGVEALLRWEHPKYGLLSPGYFIELAERGGLMPRLGGWVLNEACRQNKAWQTAGYAPLRMAVNIAAQQLARPDFAAGVVRALKSSGLAARWLELELTETSRIENLRDARQQLAFLRELGVHIALDDFGTGYSSFSYLSELPGNILKIDRSFVQDVADSYNRFNPAIIRALVQLSRELNLELVAEGVENQTQLAFLRRAGCHRVQGYLFSPAVSALDLEESWLRQPRSFLPQATEQIYGLDFRLGALRQKMTARQAVG